MDLFDNGYSKENKKKKNITGPFPKVGTYGTALVA